MDNTGKDSPNRSVAETSIAPEFQIWGESQRQLREPQTRHIMEYQAMRGKGYQGVNSGGYDRHFEVGPDRWDAEYVGKHVYKLTVTISQEGANDSEWS